MPFGTSSFGPYLWTFDGTSIGMIEGEPVEQFIPESIDRRASLFGSSVVDSVETGAQVFLSLIIKEWIASVKAAMHPWTNALGNYGQAGRSGLDLSKAIVATAAAGTPAATNGPVTRTWAHAKLAGGHNIETKFACNERNIPLTFRIYPDIVTINSTSQAARWFIDT